MNESRMMTWTMTFPCGGDPDLPDELRQLHLQSDNTLAKEEIEEAFARGLKTAHHHAAAAATMAWLHLAWNATIEPPVPMLHAAIRYVLEGEAKGRWERPKCDTAAAALDDDATRDALARKLRDAVHDLTTFAGMEKDSVTIPKGEEARKPDDPDADHPMLWWDARAGDFLETLGHAGHDGAELTRDEARNRWEEVHRQTTIDGEPGWGRLWELWWKPGGDRGVCPILLRLTLVLWLDRWRPEMEAEREAEWRVGAFSVGPFDDALAPLMSPRREVAAPARDGRQLVLLFDETGHEVGYFEGWVLDDFTTTAIDRLRSPAFIRLASVGANAVAKQQALRVQSPLITELPGRTELAQMLGLRSVGDLDELFDAAQRYRGEGIDATGRKWFIRGLFNVCGTEAPAPGQASRTLLQWSPGLFVGRGWKTPMPDADDPWPLLGSKARAKGMFAHVLIHRQLAERSLEMAKEGHAPMAWGEIAAAAALGRRPMANLRRLELEGQGEHAPWLIEVVPGRYRLADEKRHDFLVRQGQMRGFRQAGGESRAATAEREAGKFAKKKGYKGRTRKG